MLRDIEETSTATNSTGVEHDVVVIHDQNWFNLTGVGGFGFEGLSAGAHHNQTWSYDVVQAEYENRTVYRRWQTTGPDADVGETFPPRSPIVVEPVAPSPDPGLGSIDLPRESGWVAIPAVQGDRFVLDATPAAVLTVTIGSEGTDVREGRDRISFAGMVCMPTIEAMPPGAWSGSGHSLGCLATSTAPSRSDSRIWDGISP